MAKDIKRDRFERVAYARANKILEMLELLGNCANPGNYDYDHKQVNSIFSDIDAAIKRTKREFSIELERMNKKKK